VDQNEQNTSLIPLVIAAALLGLAFLAVVVMPNFFLVASRPSEVANAKREIRNLSAPLETYYIDQNSYPPAVDATGKPVRLGESGEGISSGFVPWMLTSPIAYATSIPADPFVRGGFYPVNTFRYATNGISCWIMTSDGPDQDIDMPIAEFPAPATGNCNLRGFLSHFGGTAIEYAGTNGTTSSGDIVRVGP
jgi:hypothetical protein